MDIKNYLESARFVGVIVLTLAALVAADVNAQTDTTRQPGSSSLTRNTARVSVGDKEVNGLLIKPYKNVWKVTLMTPAGQTVPNGTWTDEVSIVRLNGQDVLKRTQAIMRTADKPHEILVNVVDPKTFAPIMSDSRMEDGTYWHREFNGSGVSGTQVNKPNESPTPIDAKFDRPFFDFYGGMFGVLISTFPLKEGYSATFLSDYQDNDGKEVLKPVTFNVAREEMVAAGAGKQVKAFVVEVDLPYGHDEFWLVQKPPYVIKLVYTGPRGGKQIFEMI